MRALVLVLALLLSACNVGQRSLDEGVAWGTVLSIEELPLDDPEETARAYDHLLVPEVAWKVVVRLDGGAAVTVTDDGERRHEPGERVRVLFGDDGALLL